MSLAECRFPELPTRYDRSLREAVAFILERFEPLGIIASGSIVRGVPDERSDHDINVLVPGDKRIRIQRFFNAVPVEIFVNPLAALERYFANDARDNRPITAHMIATGFVVLDRDPAVETLRGLAAEYLERPTEVDDAQLTWLRYASALRYEDAIDVLDSDPDTASLLLASAVVEMLRFVFFAVNGRPVPRWKEMLECAEEADPEAGALLRRFFREPRLEGRVRIVGELFDRSVGSRGFFEWESPERGMDDF